MLQCSQACCETESRLASLWAQIKQPDLWVEFFLLHKKKKKPACKTKCSSKHEKQQIVFCCCFFGLTRPGSCFSFPSEAFVSMFTVKTDDKQIFCSPLSSLFSQNVQRVLKFHYFFSCIFSYYLTLMYHTNTSEWTELTSCRTSAGKMN